LQYSVFPNQLERRQSVQTAEWSLIEKLLWVFGYEPSDMNTTFTEDGISEEKISEKASRVRVHLSTGAYPKGNKKSLHRKENGILGS